MGAGEAGDGQPAPARPGGRRAGFAATLLLASALLSVAAGEALVRVLDDTPIPTSRDERTLTYRHDPRLGWFPREGGRTSFRVSRLVEVRHNRDGFRDVDHGPKTRPRLAFLGDSHVWGYDVEATERFTDRLQEKLPDWEVFNMGVSGYGTDQAWLLLQDWFDRVRPDVVVHVFCDENDWADNGTNNRYGGYFKPYFQIEDGVPVAHGIPVPRSLHSVRVDYPLFFRSRLVQLAVLNSRPGQVFVDDPTVALLDAMQAFVRSRGARFVLAFVDTVRGGDDCDFCDGLGVEPLLLRSDHKYPIHSHWTPDGHEEVAAQVHAFLEAKGLLEIRPGD